MPIKRTRPKATGVKGIAQDGPERFLVRTWITDPKTGRQMKKEGVATSLVAAIALKEELRGEKKAVTRSRPRWRDFGEEWLASVAPTLAISTRERYINAVAHLTARFGEFFVDAIEAVDVRRWRDEVLKNSARATVNGWHRVFRQALARAVEDGIIRTNPAKAVPTVAEKRTGGRRGRSLSVDELRRFLDSLHELVENDEIAEDVGRMIEVLVWTGMRRGELFALRWTDIQADELVIERSIYRRTEKETKTDDPRRTAIPPPLARLFEEQRRWLVERAHPGQVSGLIFPSSLKHAKAGATRVGSDGLVWFRSGSCLDDPLQKVVAVAKVPEISPHSFRRIWENLLRKAGVDQLVRRSLAGWRSEDAQEIYAGIDVEERRQAVGAVARLVCLPGGGQNQHPTPTPEHKNENGSEAAASNPSR